MAQHKKRVGVAWNQALTRNLNFEDAEVLDVYRSHGLELVKVDLLRSLEDQGPFDVIVQKVVDVHAESKEDRARAIQNIEEYAARHPACLVLNPTTNIELLNDRARLFPFMKEVVQSVSGEDFFCPAFVELSTTDVDEMRRKLQDGGVSFPIVCKPIVGTDHEMTVVFSQAGLGQVPAHCVAQAFVNHGATLYKSYMMGDRQWHFARKSVADLLPGVESPPVRFHSPSVGQLDQDHILRAEPGELRPLPEEEKGRLGQLGQRIRRALAMDLIGLDYIYDVTSGRYAVIDVNDFPAYTGAKDFHQCLSNYIWDQHRPEDK